jgi:hypothetical protein
MSEHEWNDRSFHAAPTQDNGGLSVEMRIDGDFLWVTIEPGVEYAEVLTGREHSHEEPHERLVSVFEVGRLISQWLANHPGNA